MEIEDYTRNQLGQDIWSRKYQHEGETLEEFFERVAGGNDNIKNRMKNREFLFAGRILAHRGLPQMTGRKVCYSNCFVTEPPQDTIESIFDTAKRMARTYSYGG